MFMKLINKIFCGEVVAPCELVIFLEVGVLGKRSKDVRLRLNQNPQSRITILPKDFCELKIV